MTHADITRKIAVLIEEYTGETVTAIDVIADPNVAHALAIRAKLEGHTRLHEFLITDVAIEDATEDDLFEVQFTTWPPRSGWAR